MKKIGIIGAGVIGLDHRNAIVKHPDCCMSAVCDVVVEEAIRQIGG